jgi:hypothetical protein
VIKEIYYASQTVQKNKEQSKQSEAKTESYQADPSLLSTITVQPNHHLTMSHHDDRFIPERKKLDQLSVVKDYSAIPRLEYR